MLGAENGDSAGVDGAGVLASPTGVNGVGSGGAASTSGFSGAMVLACSG